MTNNDIVAVRTNLNAIPGVIVRATWNHLPHTEGVEVVFPNGWGVSIARGQGTYGGNRGLFEAAIIDPEGTFDDSSVKGWMTHDEVAEFVAEVAGR